jgi:DNA-binding response OmpR family regulator
MRQAFVVSDDRNFLRKLAAILVSLRWQARAASTFEHAIRHLGSHETRVVLVDIEMAGGQGFELIATARRASRSLRIVAVTRRNNKDLWEKVAHACGADEYLVGPVQERALQVAVTQEATSA